MATFHPSLHRLLGTLNVLVTVKLIMGKIEFIILYSIIKLNQQFVWIVMENGSFTFLL